MRASVVFAFASLAAARNPIVSDVGMADPHVHIFEGIHYVYATHDFSNTNTGFLMRDWYIYSSPDLVEWTRAAVLLPADTSSTAPTECWATDAAVRNGRYFWYLSFGLTEIGVVAGPTPVGPWTDPLGAPLVNASVAAALQTQMRDPSAFIDDDGAAYLVFGTFNYYIARLGEDMMSLAEAPRPVVVRNATSQNGVGVLDDKPFLHRKGGMYYFSFGAFYGV